MAEVAIFDARAVFAAVSPAEAIERTRTAFERHATGEWVMPAKVYVEAAPHGDFRAMPARGAGLATLKWVTSFPRNRERGLPAVAGALLVSSAETRRAARDPRLRGGHLAAHRRRRGGLGAGAGARGLHRGRGDRLRRQRGLGSPLPGGGGLRSRDLLRSAARGGRGARRRAGLERRRARDGGGAGRRRHRHPGRRARDRRLQPAPRPAPRRARRRCPRQGRGRARSAGSLPPFLRRVGAGLAGRRALDGGPCGGRRPWAA